jgi:hypothetical protein
MAADTISGYIQGLLHGIELKQTAYALDRDSRKAALARFHHGSPGLDPRSLPPKNLRTRDIYIPDLHIDAIKVKTRDFRARAVLSRALRTSSEVASGRHLRNTKAC